MTLDDLHRAARKVNDYLPCVEIVEGRRFPDMTHTRDGVSISACVKEGAPETDFTTRYEALRLAIFDAFQARNL